MIIRNAPPVALLAYPMHGQHKLSHEGYRTRDGHLIEWFGRLAAQQGGVAVVSRPEPRLVSRSARRTSSPAPGTAPISTTTWRPPDPRRRRRWWVTSARYYPTINTARSVPAVVWNPFVALAPRSADPFSDGRTTVLDLLDDWTRHYAFTAIRAEVEDAYRAAFDRATHVTANAEGTLALAHRLGRSDAVLLPNGCDPDRFDARSVATGPTTVGYVGKIGRRLDLGGIVETVRALPDMRFVFAGPVLDAEYRGPLSALPNVDLLGDVHYEDVPALLRTFDVGWVPHHVGEREVGGDIIKTYEYRAAGLPTLSTPVDGAGARGVDGVTSAPIEAHAAVLARWTESSGRVARRPTTIPAAATWEHKASVLLDRLGIATGTPR